MSLGNQFDEYNFTWGEESDSTPEYLSSKYPLVKALAYCYANLSLTIHAHNIDWKWHTQTTVECKKTSIDGLENTFVVDNVLSVEDCEQYITNTNRIGKKLIATSSVPIIWPNPTHIRTSSRLIWQVPYTHSEFLFNLIKKHFVKTVQDDEGGTWTLCGLNSRFRFHKYEEGQVFKQHHDAACASVKDEKRQRSFFSVLFYLNDDFEGGETEFYASSEVSPKSVKPKRGSVLVFPHDGAPGNASHSGVVVKYGTKYVLRTDAMYEQ